MLFPFIFSKKATPIIATDELHLLQLIKNQIAREGLSCSLNHIDVSNVKNMSYLFSRFRQFNGDISQWDTSNVTSMRMMFGDSTFNKDISAWDVSNVSDMSEMFWNSLFNGNISQWNVANVTDMNAMFEQSSFDGDISRWDVAKVTDMGAMFRASTFNRDISEWDVRNVSNFSSIFDDSAFRGNLMSWDIKSGCVVSNSVTAEVFQEFLKHPDFVFSSLALACMLSHRDTATSTNNAAYQESRVLVLEESITSIRCLGIDAIAGGKYLSQLMAGGATVSIELARYTEFLDVDAKQ